MRCGRFRIEKAGKGGDQLVKETVSRSPSITVGYFIRLSCVARHDLTAVIVCGLIHAAALQLFGVWQGIYPPPHVGATVFECNQSIVRTPHHKHPVR